MNKLSFAGILALLLASAAQALAGDGEESGISTDRPDFTESTDTVALGATQLEGGVSVSRHALPAGASHELGAPFLLVRFGLARFAEFRLGSDGFALESKLVNGQWEQHAGSSDLEAG